VEEAPGRSIACCSGARIIEKEGNALSLSARGGHGVPRIVHGNGGLTGKVVVDGAARPLRASSNVNDRSFYVLP